MFSIHGAVEEARSWTWDEFTALPTEEVTVEIHCVTMWSKLDTRWKDVSVDTLFDGVETEADWVTVTADGDHTTNLGLEDVTDGRRGSPTSTAARRPPAKHRGPARLLVPQLVRLEEREVVPCARSRARLPDRASVVKDHHD